MIQEPKYHLEGVIRSRNELEDFSGPLDVILMLLSKNRIEIRDIQISQLLEQYLDYLHQMQEMDLEIASEFVQMASHLMYIKTRMLLTEEKETTELEVLVSALQQLKNKEAIEAVREIAARLGEMSRSGERMQSRGPLPRGVRPYDYRHQPEEMIAALTNILLRGQHGDKDEELVSLKKAAPRPIVFSVREKSGQLLKRIRAGGSVRLKALFAECGSRSELVAAFLSVLELCSSGHIRLDAENDDYNVTAGENPDAEMEEE